MHYIGKDVVHRGSGLLLDPAALHASLAHSARKNVRKAQRFGFEIERSVGTREELAGLRALWYHPDDPNFPEELGPDDVCYRAFLDGELVGGMILVPVGTHYFLNNLLADERAKEGQLQSLLLWNAVHDLADSGYRYIDIGVSYRPNLQRFFVKWRSFDYPVLFHPPAILPRISFRPFQRLRTPRAEADPERLAAFCHGRPFTLLPDRELALEVARDRGHAPREVTAPGEGPEVEVVDLTELLPLPHGALLVGEEIPTAELWSRHGCYDFVKTAALERFLTEAAAGWTELCARRVLVWEELRDRFAHEDTEPLPPGSPPASFAMSVGGAEALAERYRRFGVEARVIDGTLHLPCHQELESVELEYVHAIYRGHLNLCSAWTPTGVRGRLKV
jgi:hypothetical protein